MHRLAPFLFALLLVLVLAPAVSAENQGSTSNPQVLEEMTADFELLFDELLAGQTPRPVFEVHENGLHSMTIHLDPATVSQRADDGTLALATLTILAAGQQLTEPSNASTLIHAAHSDKDFDYNYWWAAVNVSGSDLTRSTKITLTGAGNKFNETLSLLYEASTIKIWWYPSGFGVGSAGTHTFKAKITGGGTAKVKSYAD